METPNMNSLYKAFIQSQSQGISPLTSMINGNNNLK